jgi:hypothetical protein
MPASFLAVAFFSSLLEEWTLAWARPGALVNGLRGLLAGCNTARASGA